MNSMEHNSSIRCFMITLQDGCRFVKVRVQSKINICQSVPGNRMGRVWASLGDSFSIS